MSILTWIEDKKRLKILAAPKHVDRSADSSKGLWTRCDKCGVILYIKHLKENQRVCFGCSYHLQMMSQERIENLLDKMPAPSSSRRKKSASGGTSSLRSGGTRSSARETIVSTWRPLDETVSPCDPLHFHDQKDYTERLRDAQERTGLQDAIQTGTGMIDGIPVALAVMDFSFMGGSMGSVVGEKITRLIEYATQEGLTLLIVSASGGARMQEGVFSLMQMAKISSALQIYQKCANLLYISILSSPTTGGVTASFAMLGDIIFAEPKALIAFAGRRVIEQTLCEDLPDDFQTSEYMLHHGLVDLIVPRRFLRQALSESIRLYQNAPFKKRGQIPFGVQNPITFITEERVRRQWGRLVKEVRKGGVGVKDNPLIAPNKSSIGKGGEVLSPLALQDKFTPSEDGALAGARTAVYREILTSFEIMLALFVSGNSKKQKQSDAFSANKASLVEHNPAKVRSLQLSKKRSGNAPSPLHVKVDDKSKSRSFSARVGVPGFLKSVSNRVEEWSATQPPQSFLSGVAKRDKRFLMAFASQNVRTTFLTSRFFNREYSISRDYRKNQPLYLLLKANFRKVTPQKQSSFSAHTLAPQGLAYVLGPGGKAIARNQNGNIPISEQTWGVTQSKQPPLVHNSNGNNVLRSSCPSSKGMGQTSKGIKTERWRDNQKKPLLPSFSKQDRPRSAKSTRLHELGKVKLPLSKHISTAFSLNKNKGEEPQGEAPKKNQPFSNKSSICKWYKSNSFQNGPKNVQSAIKKVRPIASLSFNCKNKGKLYKKVSTCKKLTNFLKDVEKSFFVPKSFLTGVSPYTRLKQSFVREACLDFDLFSGIIPSQQESDTLSFGSVLQSKTSQKGRDVYPTLASQDQLQETGAYLERSRFDLLHSFRFFSEGAHILNNGPGSALASPAFKGRELDNAINRSAIGMTHTAYLCQRALSSLLSIGLQSSDNLQSGNKNSIRRVLTLTLTNRGFVTPSPSRASCKSSYFLPHTLRRTARGTQAKIRKEQGNGKMQKGVYKKGSVKTHLYKKQLGSGSKPSFINGNGSVLSEGLSSKAMQSQSLDKASKDSLRRENDLNFLNQAIELAATESIEWRAFYIHQQLCENTGFLEDFLQKNSSSTSFGESAKTGNVLFYKSICRSKKTLDD